MLHVTSILYFYPPPRPWAHSHVLWPDSACDSVKLSALPEFEFHFSFTLCKITSLLPVSLLCQLVTWHSWHSLHHFLIQMLPLHHQTPQMCHHVGIARIFHCRQAIFKKRIHWFWHLRRIFIQEDFNHFFLGHKRRNPWGTKRGNHQGRDSIYWAWRRSLREDNTAGNDIIHFIRKSLSYRNKNKTLDAGKNSKIHLYSVPVSCLNDLKNVKKDLFYRKRQVNRAVFNILP